MSRRRALAARCGFRWLLVARLPSLFVQWGTHRARSLLQRRAVLQGRACWLELGLEFDGHPRSTLT